MENENDLVVDLIKHLRDQNRRQRTAFLVGISAVCLGFAGVLVGQNARWMRHVTELMKD